MRDFEYGRADTVNHAVLQNLRATNASYLAGGTTLLDLVKLDVMRPEKVVDVNRLALKEIQALPDGRVRVGALVTNTMLARHPLIRSRYSVLSQAILAGASTQIRNKATTAGNVMQRVRCNYFRDGLSPCNKRNPGSGCAAIGGNNRSVHAVLGTSAACIATHPSDMCVAMMAIGATVTVQGDRGIREIDFSDFHLLPGGEPWKEHALFPGELITQVTLDPALERSRSGYLKLRDRASYQFALASSAVIVVMDGQHIKHVRIALGGVGTKPWRAFEAERLLEGNIASGDTVKAAAEAVFRNAQTYSQNGYKVALGQQAIVRNLRDLTA
jgi:xanthine dehydrogenase YagS FAD-binding subunit